MINKKWRAEKRSKWFLNETIRRLKKYFSIDGVLLSSVKYIKPYFFNE